MIGGWIVLMLYELSINKIYNCNYKDKIFLVKNESVDMVLTDIPYLISRPTNFESIKNYSKIDGSSAWDGMEFGDWDASFDIENYIYHCTRILRPSSSIIVWASWQQLELIDCLIKYYLGASKGEPRIGIWKKTNPPVFNMQRMSLQPYEFFIWNRKGSNCIFNNQNGEGGIVFDGCMGGGTTAVAAIETKRRFIGFEIEKEYCEIAKESLNKINKTDYKDSIIYFD